MENRDIGLIIGGSIVLALTAIGLAIYGIRKMNKIVSNVIECTSGYEGVDNLEEVKSGDELNGESDGEHNTLEVSSEILDNLWNDVDDLDKRTKKLKEEYKGMDKDIKELQKSGEEYDERLTEREMKENLRLARELVAFGKAINAELAPQAGALAQDKKIIEGKLGQLQQSENRVEISNLMLDGLNKVDELLIRRGVLTLSDSLDYDGGKGNGAGL